jgi:hypothetical protein
MDASGVAFDGECCWQSSKNLQVTEHFSMYGCINSSTWMGMFIFGPFWIYVVVFL